jgi:hypothetical protein
MKRLVFMVCVLAFSAVVIPTAALAKGASEARIVGPGLSAPIRLGGSGEPGSGGQLADIAMSAGFFAAVFGQTPDPLVQERPDGSLGPKYTVTYVMPGPDNLRSELVQDVYPYAEPSPVTYTAPGQRFWTTERTHGGWYFATWEPVKDQLVAAGLPATAPAVGGGEADGFPWVVVGVLAALGVAAIVALTATGRRHRPAAA